MFVSAIFLKSLTSLIAKPPNSSSKTIKFFVKLKRLSLLFKSIFVSAKYSFSSFGKSSRKKDVFPVPCFFPQRTKVKGQTLGS
jgi:hypothetical protein